MDFGGSEGRGSRELEVWIRSELASQPEERLLKVVVGLCRDVVVLQVLFAMESNGLGLDFALLDVYLVSTKDNGNVLANADQVPMPVGNILVGNTRSHVKHDDGTLSLDAVFTCVRLLFTCIHLLKKKQVLLVSITKTTKLFLSLSILPITLN